ARGRRRNRVHAAATGADGPLHRLRRLRHSAARSGRTAHCTAVRDRRRRRRPFVLGVHGARTGVGHRRCRLVRQERTTKMRANSIGFWTFVATTLLAAGAALAQDDGGKGTKPSADNPAPGSSGTKDAGGTAGGLATQEKVDKAVADARRSVANHPDRFPE